MKEEEKYLIEAIEDLLRQYEKAVQPYINRLVDIRAREMLTTIITEQELQELRKHNENAPAKLVFHK